MQLLETNWTYALILVLSLAGLTFCDWRWKLVAYLNVAARKATLMSIAALVSFFIIWDIAGIALGIFYTNPRYTLGINLLTANLPIEEVLFLILLSYSILIINAVAQRYYQTLHKS